MEKIVAIVGPTAVGKSDIAVEIALSYNGEVVSADSRQVYQGLDIGSGKITQSEMRGVPHHLLDIADPKDTYSLKSFIEHATSVIKHIHTQGSLPILCGGTGLYIDSVVNGAQLPAVPPNEKLRAELSQKNTEELYALLLEKDKKRAQTIDRHNPRRLIRALEIIEALGSVEPLSQEKTYDTLYVGLILPTEELHARIHERLLKRIANGLLHEVKKLHDNGLSFERMEELGLEYKYFAYYLQNKLSFEDMSVQLETAIRQYAKRQMTWFKRNKEVEWFEPKDLQKIQERVASFLLSKK
ncbi:MAG: tRNA (adenosine(37)-N6)-dimethylallyltransferase MiaA [Candidatus Paceibacterota bacterium]